MKHTFASILEKVGLAYTINDDKCGNMILMRWGDGLGLVRLIGTIIASLLFFPIAMLLSMLDSFRFIQHKIASGAVAEYCRQMLPAYILDAAEENVLVRSALEIIISISAIIAFVRMSIWDICEFWELPYAIISSAPIGSINNSAVLELEIETGKMKQFLVVFLGKTS